jgi:hypothetical protein
MMELLTVYFDCDGRYATLRRNDKRITKIDGSNISVKCGKVLYDGRIVGLSSKFILIYGTVYVDGVQKFAYICF